MAQRVYGLALGYEDLNDHDQLREDPLLAVLAARRDAGRAAGGQEHAQPAGADAGSGAAPRPLQEDPLRRQKPSTSCWWTCSWKRTAHAPAQIVLDLDVTDLPLHGHQEGRFFHGYYDELLLPAAVHLLRRASAVRAAADGRSGCRGRQPGRRWSGSWSACGQRGRRCRSSCGPIRASAGRS